MAYPNLALSRSLLRFPHWYRATPCIRTLNFSVADVNANLYTVGVPITEISESAAIKACSTLLVGIGASSLVKTGRAGPNLGLLAHTTVMSLMARMYHQPDGTTSAWFGYDSFLGGFVMELAGSADPLLSFFNSAVQFTHPFNAYSAGVAWLAAPWAASAPAEIVYPNDPSLPVLPTFLIA